ncbi:Non-LTR retroelement reverse transcriptase [Gossypium australe]|uniref:Non-LTR retroelement reverse transcriptase n=1 Tax=Gossypium australe TaxID=47621 RepID=A0A5B6V9I4_9ROSI|nr:Non-LTR retroelement reverse transcriptase [Gossypium australe]
MFVTFVYGSPKKRLRSFLWERLDYLAQSIKEPWRGGWLAISGCKLFQKFIQDDGLWDLGFEGPEFTWRRGVVFERLDKAIENSKWFCSFLDVVLFHLPQLKSDHQPILISSQLTRQTRHNISFLFLASWIKHPSFSQLIKDSWKIGLLCQTILFLFGIKKCITIRKRSLARCIENIQAILDLLDQEELIWLQNS